MSITIGYIGGSITQLPVGGYHAVTDENLFWPAITAYGGGRVSTWNTNPLYWSAFNKHAALRPPDVVWWMLTIKDDDMVSTRQINKWARNILDTLRNTGFTGPVYASAMPKYPDGSCSQINLAPAESDRLLSTLLGKGLVSMGPPVLPLYAKDTKDGCHHNATAAARQGIILAEWSRGL